MGRDRLNIAVTNPAQQRALENALAAVEDELGAELHRDRGRPGEGQISTPEALVELARAYTGVGPEAFADG